MGLDMQDEDLCAAELKAQAPESPELCPEEPSALLCSGGEGCTSLEFSPVGQ